MARGAGLVAALAPACTARPVRLAAGFALGWGAAFALALGAATNFFGGTECGKIVAHLVKGPQQWPTHVHQVCVSGTVHGHREKTSWV